MSVTIPADRAAGPEDNAKVVSVHSSRPRGRPGRNSTVVRDLPCRHTLQARSQALSRRDHTRHPTVENYHRQVNWIGPRRPNSWEESTTADVLANRPATDNEREATHQEPSSKPPSHPTAQSAQGRELPQIRPRRPEAWTWPTTIEALADRLAMDIESEATDQTRQPSTSHLREKRTSGEPQLIGVRIADSRCLSSLPGVQDQRSPLCKTPHNLRPVVSTIRQAYDIPTPDFRQAPDTLFHMKGGYMTTHSKVSQGRKNSRPCSPRRHAKRS